MVECSGFNMWSMSIAQLFGKTPKVSYICGRCGHYNEGRMSMRQVEWGDPYLICNCCGEANHIPIHLTSGDDFDDY